MKKFWILTLSFIFLVIFSVSFFPHVLINFVADRALGPGTQIHVKSGRFNILSGQLNLFQVEAASGDKQVTHYDFEIKELVALLKFSYKHLTITDLAIHSPEVRITEGPKTAPKGQSSLPFFEVNRVKIKNGSFSYTYLTPEGPARFSAQNISAETTYIFSRPVMGDERVHFTVEGILANSGKTRVEVSADLFRANNRDDILITLEKHNLESMNPFFEKDSHIKLEGHIEKAIASLTLSQGRLAGSLGCRYKDLKIKFLKEKDESQFKTFLENVVASAVTKPDSQEDLKVRPVSADRLKDESIFKFILRGLRVSAQDLITKSKVGP